MLTKASRSISRLINYRYVSNSLPSIYRPALLDRHSSNNQGGRVLATPPLTPPWGWGSHLRLFVSSGLEWRGSISIHSSGRELCAFFFPLPHHISVRWAVQLLLHWKQSTDLSWTLSMTWEWQYQACNPALKRCAMQNRLIAATKAGVKLMVTLN